eukprot:gnl/TRDRNA2_/TRDRNA2_28406_c0_seq1.p1 gnl/TRDRNA2_/TRDRNA2_28406_c0~~gnl/TRDRNA2_/TRDRNA2_28406_c0_seq1.p1  ORF type:complete len:290 (-),score=34.93 gnl/TRDRNA2_/TRDRNA2_28406_c0_seq1:271-1140(-)
MSKRKLPICTQSQESTSITVPTLDLEDLQCPICMELMIGNILMCTLGHSTCENCHTSLPVPKLCSECRTGFATPPTRNFALEHIMAKTILPCSNAGCSYTAKASDLGVHKLKCPFRALTCRDLFKEGCDAKITCSEFPQHCREQHANCVLHKRTRRFEFDEAYMDKYRGLSTKWMDVGDDALLMTARFLDCNFEQCKKGSNQGVDWRREILHVRMFHTKGPRKCKVSAAERGNSVEYTFDTEPLASQVDRVDDRTTGALVLRNSLLQLRGDSLDPFVVMVHIGTEDTVA